ncbi:multiple sugar transport system substrate-binding protein [Alicyclobacillus sacchari]|uniref:Multiple sugar transport system substrate-binding protein n=1 Tax=Alicyclobacillus sacchari TaxID=392010 RepID=A0A4V3HEU1_9BACL|nr:extracellular solute-binding protein [Alicyclobacillus sacchari]TDY50211.1 multiple sugar transport system substrate-binding protein [Alicyclobacillus sacchari]
MRYQKVMLLGVFVGAVTFTLAGCGQGPVENQAAAGNVSQMAGSTIPRPVLTAGLPLPKYTQKATITWWSWVPNAQTEVNIFEKYYPNIKVKLVNAGAGSTEYQKFSTVVQAGSGIPDVVMLEFDMMPQYISTGALQDISKYVGNLKSKFSPWTWSEVSMGGGVYGIPEDTGPMGLFYQTSLFKKYNLAVPTTWAQFEQEALVFHKKDPKQYFSYFSDTDGQWMFGLLWQAGVLPFQGSGNNWSVRIDTPEAVKVFSMWQRLVKAGAVQNISDFGPAWEKNLNNGMYATAVGSAWYDSEALVPYDHNLSSQKWHAALIPQWTVGGTMDGDWGGSVQAVTKASKYPEAAAIFAAFINASPAELPHDVAPAKDGGGGLFPAATEGFGLPAFKAKNPALDNQPANVDVFEEESSRVNAKFQWSPWSSYVFNELQTEIGRAFAGKESVQQALANVQQQVMSYARSQGYSVSS